MSYGMTFAAALAAALVTSPTHAQVGSGITGSIQADSVPTDLPWTQPARVAFTIDTKGPDSFAVDIAAKAYFPLGGSPAVFGLGEIAWHRNSQQEKKQNQLQASGGLHYEWENFEPGLERGRLWSIFADGKVSYSQKSVYADSSKPVCVADPDAAPCQTQYVESVRVTLDVSPHNGLFESDQRKFNLAQPDADRSSFPSWIYNFGFVTTLFHDSVTENVIDPDTGLTIAGSVTGSKLSAGLLVTPRWADYRLNFRIQGQWVEAFSRSAGRRQDFGGSSHLLTASVDFDFLKPSVAEGSGFFRPSAGITYTEGSDPLTGRADQSTIVLALKVFFK